MRKTLVASATALLLVGAVGGVAVAADQDQDQVRDRDQTCSQDCDGGQTRSMLHHRDGSGTPQGEQAQEQHRHHYRYQADTTPDSESGHQGFGAVHRGPGSGGSGTCAGEGPEHD